MNTLNDKFWNALRRAALFFMTASLAHASVISWLSRTQRDGDFMPGVGGIEVAAVKIGHGRPAARVRFRRARGNYRLRYENPDCSYFEMGALIVP